MVLKNMVDLTCSMVLSEMICLKKASDSAELPVVEARQRPVFREVSNFSDRPDALTASIAARVE